MFRKGASFSEWATQEEAGFSKEKGNQYQPSTDALVKVLAKFNITSEDSIIDIGCGKGKAMYMMSHFPFRKITGFDLSEKLVGIANENFKKLDEKDAKRCLAVQADATTFDQYDEFNYFYAYNPFPEEIFKIMMSHVVDSIKRTPRTCRFIYLNPVCHEYIEANTPFKLVYKRKSLGAWFDYYCYEYRCDEAE